MFQYNKVYFLFWFFKYIYICIYTVSESQKNSNNNDCIIDNAGNDTQTQFHFPKLTEMSESRSLPTMNHSHLKHSIKQSKDDLIIGLFY